MSTIVGGVLGALLALSLLANIFLLFLVRKVKRERRTALIAPPIRRTYSDLSTMSRDTTYTISDQTPSTPSMQEAGNRPNLSLVTSGPADNSPKPEFVVSRSPTVASVRNFLSHRKGSSYPNFTSASGVRPVSELLYFDEPEAITEGDISSRPGLHRTGTARTYQGSRHNRGLSVTNVTDADQASVSFLYQ